MASYIWSDIAVEIQPASVEAHGAWLGVTDLQPASAEGQSKKSFVGDAEIQPLASLAESARIWNGDSSINPIGGSGRMSKAWSGEGEIQPIDSSGIIEVDKWIGLADLQPVVVYAPRIWRMTSDIQPIEVVTVKSWDAEGVIHHVGTVGRITSPWVGDTELFHLYTEGVIRIINVPWEVAVDIQPIAVVGTFLVLVSQVDGTVNVVNMATGDTTQYTSYGFNSFTEFNGSLYGLNATGLYKLTGDNDNNVAIDAIAEFAPTDLGSDPDTRDGLRSNEADAHKVFDYVYVTVRETGDFRVGLEVDEKDRRVTNVDTSDSPAGLHTRRAKFGKNLKGRMVRVILQNSVVNSTTNSSFDIASVSVAPTITRKRVR